MPSTKAKRVKRILNNANLKAKEFQVKKDSMGDKGSRAERELFRKLWGRGIKGARAEQELFKKVRNGGGYI